MTTFYLIMWIAIITATAIYFIIKYHYRLKPKEFRPIIDLEYWNTDSILLLNMINDYRIFHGLHTLLPEKLNHDIADIRCTTVISNFFIEGRSLSHSGSLDVSSMMLKEGIKAMDENINYGSNSNISAFRNFTEDKNHNNNMLNPKWKYIGIDIRTDPTIKRKFYVVIFSY